MSNAASGSFADDVERTLIRRREIHLLGAVDASMAYYAVKLMRYLTMRDERASIRIYLNTPGGTVLDGLSLYDHIRFVARKTPVDIIASGACMSMGLVILQAATNRISYPHTRFLLHELQTGTRGSLSNIRDDVSEAEKLQRILDGIISGRTGHGIPALRKLTARRDCFLNAEDALRFKLIDKIVRD
jgi:ATP-dependent Clp protease protease subunit